MVEHATTIMTTIIHVLTLTNYVSNGVVERGVGKPLFSPNQKEIRPEFLSGLAGRD